jgi:ELWxxDGT repeat protein
MSSLDPAIFSSHSNLKLRVWFSDGANGFQQLSPDRTFASVPYALNAGSVNLGSGSISRSMLTSDILNDLNGIIGKNRLSQHVLDDLNRTITHSMLDSNIQSILDNANSSNRPATISGEHNITNESIIFADRNATGNLLVNLPSASANDGRSVRLIPANNKPIRIESLSGELDGGDWANVNQFVEVASNQGVWFTIVGSISIGVRGKLKDIFPGSGSSNPNYFTDINGTLFFTAYDPTNGQELWKSDGTEAGTTMVKDIYPGSNGSSPQYLTDVNGTLFFQANDDTNGYELWKSDGTQAGTTLVKDIRPGSASSSPQYLTDVNGTLFFSAQDPEGRELWKFDP